MRSSGIRQLPVGHGVGESGIATGGSHDSKPTVADSRTKIEVMGPFRASVAGVEVAVVGRPRVVLAALALAGGRVVSIDALMEYSWGQRLPQRPRSALHIVVARVRKPLGDQVIDTVGDGYALNVEHVDVDLLRFRSMVRQAGGRGGPDRTPAERDLLGEALELWRGQPLDGVPSERLRQDMEAGLREEWMAALRRRIDLDLAAGLHEQLLGELRQQVVDEPLREWPWHRLMLALYRCGRRADALASYQTMRTTLRDQVGLDPGFELRQLHEAILRDEVEPPAAVAIPIGSATGPVPRQLRAGISGFTGRERELAALDRTVAEAYEPTAPELLILAIDGAGGVGKTALAVQWSHRVRSRFPDGQIFLNLRGYGPGGPLEAAAALASLLHSICVSPAEIPADLESRSALLRSRLAGRRLLIVLDNARDSSHVRPLLPGDGGCLVLVTSRRHLRGLEIQHGARRIAVPVFGPVDGVALLSATIGCRRVDAEPEAAAELVERCVGLPLALRIVAERARRDTELSLATLCRELDEEVRRLDAFDTGEDDSTDLRAVFGSSYDALPPGPARLFRLLGLYPGADLPVSAAAALAGEPERTVRVWLDTLAAAHLLEEKRRGRYEFHDLLRAYARELAMTAESERDQTAAITRTLDWLAHSAYNARKTAQSFLSDFDLDPADSRVRPVEFSSKAEVATWFADERLTLSAAISCAADAGLDGHAWRLASLLWEFFNMRDQSADMRSIMLIGLRSACRLGDRGAEAHCLGRLGGAYFYLRQWDDAIDCSLRANTIWRELGELRRVVVGLNNLCLGYGAAGRTTDAIAAGEQGRQLAAAIDYRDYEAISMAVLGIAYRKAGDHSRAIQLAEAAVHLQRSEDNPFRLLETVHQLGLAYADDSQCGPAIDAFRETITLARQLQQPKNEAEAHWCLGKVLRSLNRRDEAREALLRAQEIFADLGHDDLAAVREELHELNTRSSTTSAQPGLQS